MNFMTKDRLWLDDVRRPPSDEWVWARDVKSAKRYMQRHRFRMVSLDHDLGGSHIHPSNLGEDADYLQLHGEETGLDLVDWMCFNDCMPDRVRIHSMSAPGGDRMERTLRGKLPRLSNNPMIVRQTFDPSERA